MADEPTNGGGKRRRGRRRGGRPGQPSDIPAEQPQQPDISIPGEDVTQSEMTSPEADSDAGKPSRRRERKPAGRDVDVNPMDFWRSGRSRSHRTVPAGQAGGGKSHGLIYNIRHMYFPPWVPVAVIIVLVFGILGLLFVTRSATGAPRIGKDHWHASYTFYVCGVKQPNAPTWESGVHTHGDGVMHIHPFSSFEEGAGARMVKWFEYGSGKLDQDEIRLPGTSTTYKNGDVCGEDTPLAGREGVVQVFVNSKKMDNWSRYIPRDGDRIRLIFGPEESTVQLDDRLVIEESEATRTIEVTVDGNEDSTSFEPAAIEVEAGETVKLRLTNNADVSHGLRIAGADNTYDNGDDFAVVPEGSDPKQADQSEVIQPGGTGFVVIRFDDAAQIKFKDPTATNPSTQEPFAEGTIIVGAATSPTPAPEDQAEQSADVKVNDDGFDPADITFEAGKTFGLNITTEGAFAHNVRIDGPDGEFETADDIVSPDIAPGQSGRTPAKTLEAGTYRFRDDFHTDLTGTITIE